MARANNHKKYPSRLNPEGTFPWKGHVPTPRLKADPGSFAELGTSPIRRPGFGSGLLHRLVGVARETCIHLTELRQLGNIGVISLLGVLRLDLDHLLERLCAEQLLEGTGAILERLLRIVSDLSGDSLEALIHLTKRVDRGIEAVLAHPLKLFKLLNVGHLTTSLVPPYAGMLRIKIHMGCYG